ncbi:hypothetical protein F5Y05DRAFT_234868 [Hypoxylon sp. FL0543]|nr:hypothetical protein F5Y05DRAFT_234868 [Hypoxylon sp. FL0543]
MYLLIGCLFAWRSAVQSNKSDTRPLSPEARHECGIKTYSLPSPCCALRSFVPLILGLHIEKAKESYTIRIKTSHRWFYFEVPSCSIILRRLRVLQAELYNKQSSYVVDRPTETSPSQLIVASR